MHGRSEQFQHVFTAEEQRLFAETSGDFNPIHVDLALASRTIFGTTVVHGVHTLLWCLDCFAANKSGRYSLAELDASFPAPIPAGGQAELTLLRESEGSTSAKIDAKGRTTLRANFKARPARRSTWTGSTASMQLDCRERNTEDIARAAGEIPLNIAKTNRLPLLVSLFAHWCPAQIAVLLGISRLVGMECPGKKAILESIRLSFTPDVALEVQSLTYAVKRWDERFHYVRQTISGLGVHGEIGCFIRPEPVPLPTMADALKLIQKGRFSEWRAVIVGGSRGLGASTAKLIAAGGGSVRISYHQREDEGQAVLNDICQAGGDVCLFRYDVTDRTASLGANLSPDWRPTHLFFFATPRIVLDQPGEFDSTLFASYCSIYIEGFYRTFVDVARLSQGRLVAFYPSTMALDEILPRAAEYASAKAAGEAICLHLQKLYPSAKIICTRLPRILTEQTQTIVPIAAADAMTTMHAVLEKC